MSDSEDRPYQSMDFDAAMPDSEEPEHLDDQMGPPPVPKGKGRATGDDDDGEEDDEEDEDEDEEDEDMGRKGKKRAKHRHKRAGASRFLDIEAEVSDEEEDDDDDDEEAADGFISTFDDVDEDISRRDHARLDRHLDTVEDKSPEQIARDLSKRYGGRAVRYTGDMNEIPQRLLMPSVHDASLWQVRVKPGRERDIIFSLMRKSIDVEYSAHPLNIHAAFQRDSLPGMIYVEARSAKQVQQACHGLVGVYPSRGIQLVPIEEMASLLQIKKQDLTVTPGSWVRIRRGKYAGDLAQVMDIAETGEDVGIRFVPRIDLTPRDESSLDGAKKRKKQSTNATMRPPQRLFNFEEVTKVWGRKNVTKRNQVYVFQNDTYKDGLIEKDFKMSALILEDVNPTLDEITQFSKRQDGENEETVNLSIIAEASRKAAIAVLQPGDHVEVFEGEQAGVHGVVDEISQDVVTITAVGVDIDGQKVELPARSVRKRFKPGDHVKVMTGQNADETGLVVSVADNVVTFLSDMSMQEVSVFSKDLREAAEVGSGTNIVGNYELHDLVQLDAQTVGVIFKTERDSFRVLDQNGQVRLVQPHQISMRRDSSRAIATDSEGHELRINDNVKEVDGEGRKGRVLHTHQSFFAFLHNRDIVENGGVFVTRTRSLASLAPKSNVLKTAGTDLSKMNPALVAPTGGMVGSGAMGRGPRDRDIGTTVMVVKGAHKGYAGTIKDTNGHIARVELRTGNKVISIEKDKLHRRYPDGKLEPLSVRATQGQGNYGGGQRGPSSFGAPSGGRTPFNSVGRTPNPYAEGGRTPAWNASSRTPNPYAESGKTPAWNASSRTPNPYADGGRTPAWNANSRTPNPYATGANAGAGVGTGWGGATPGRTAGWGGATPGRNVTAGTGGGWGSSADSWADSSGPAWSAPTPAAAATPGLIGQTPAGYGAPTPASHTPAWYDSGTNMPPATPAAAPSWSSGNQRPSDDGPGADWLFNPVVANFLPRVKVKIEGTKMDHYLNGDYENKRGRIPAVTKVTSEFEQTVLVYFDSGDSRTIQARYVVPLPPTYMGEEVLVIHGPQKGTAMIVREQPDDDTITVSSKANPAAVVGIPKSHVLALYEDTGR